MIFNLIKPNYFLFKSNKYLIPNKRIFTVRTFATNQHKMSQINIGQLLSVCVDAAQKAGNEIRSVWKSGDLGNDKQLYVFLLDHKGVKDKGNDDPMTKADIRSQQLIMGLLYKVFSFTKILSNHVISNGQKVCC